jgi:urea carboxylase
MEGPGGYQFVGRTVQMWNPWRQTNDFRDGKPWLLRFFDQIRFYPVGEKELLRLRQDFLLGRFRLEVEETMFGLAQYNRFLQENAASILTFKQRQQAAFEAERERWSAAGQAEYADGTTAVDPGPDTELDLPPHTRAVATHLTGNLWKVPVGVGDNVAEGDPLVIIESMKMEITITAPCAGRVLKLLCREGGAVAAGQSLLLLEEEW